MGVLRGAKPGLELARREGEAMAAKHNRPHKEMLRQAEQPQSEELNEQDKHRGWERAERSWTLHEILGKYGLRYDHLEDIPVSEIRRIQIQPVFKDFRSFKLHGPMIRHALTQPVTGELLVTRIGYVTRAAGHYIPRPEGSLDHVFQYCLEGQGWCEMQGNSWKVPPEHVILIPAGVPHYYGADEDDPWTHYWIHFTGSRAAYFTELLGVTAENPVFRLPRSPHVLSSLESIYSLANLPRVTKHLVAASGALADFLGRINLERISKNTKTELAEKRVEETIDYMRKNLGQPCTLNDLARIACMSPTHYSNVFRRREACPPMEYFNRLRVQKACELLQGTNLQIQQIAHSLGFNDPFYFSRLFRGLVGKSPSDYRQGR
ncbi:MAG: helix-turn-helix domain-containing protein [Pirellulales bacterium]|nr:helix-turn-helix domain-containing protein [Pirellulales bacterium]